MKNRTAITFKIKQLKDLLENIKKYSFSETEQQRIESDIKLLEWVITDNIKPSKYL